MVVAVDANEKKSGSSLKFLCSYGGKILPRSTDGKLRYVGGHTRVLSVDRSISFEELTKKLFEFCGYSVDLRCQLPNGDLETLISVKSDEELANIVELYNRVSGSKIKAVLSPPRSQKSPSSSSGGGGDRSPNSPFSVTLSPPNSPPLAYGRYLQSRYCLPPTDLARRFHQRSGESYCYACRVHKGSRLIWH
ncbi:hypothetical protein HID58_084772 [Brassica napus]|uniref:BnaCnng15710D protein n=5 Tax=Brassica TaxID=3705 RepID=A0A078IFN9_BRANA|nr:PREDICTED: uncharacterized protein LOC106319077 [Brassica oleracea var. oleracea]XP_013703961.2 uncharacterized protein LOC106407633 [Brassica napus]XP_013707098.1 uncharacterized protein BNACNNG15710D [Brassica napus]KAG2278273.1 hypothetical protein Bca52824_060828 [Brassica carinata]KAH0856507.1 hypothetical protein HID58_084768 [Brassica napus]KAH0856511.1 hypothetical protein HID58_084772 [Brassica napus]CAF1716629.1 unnamed protein product [Brassica napus]CDY48129.1 BnaCnng15710D [B